MRSKAKERHGEAWIGHREALKELSCEGKAKRRMAKAGRGEAME